VKKAVAAVNTRAGRLLAWKGPILMNINVWEMSNIIQVAQAAIVYV
jgi:hypothetical protein